MQENLTTYQDLILAKQELKSDISKLETEIKSAKIVKVAGSLVDGKLPDITSFDFLKSINLSKIINSPIGTMFGSFFLYNKNVRKYYIVFKIIKESFPSILTMAGSFFDSDKKTEKKTKV